jgi:hypothetical protein
VLRSTFLRLPGRIPSHGSGYGKFGSAVPSDLANVNGDQTHRVFVNPGQDCGVVYGDVNCGEVPFKNECRSGEGFLNPFWAFCASHLFFSDLLPNSPLTPCLDNNVFSYFLSSFALYTCDDLLILLNPLGNFS